MDSKVKLILDELIIRYAELQGVEADIAEAYELMKAAYDKGGKLLIAGNGGSAADSEHIVGELMKGFTKKRPLDEAFVKKLIATDIREGALLSEKLQGALPAIALTGHTALTTAFANDVEGTYAFAQQLYGYGKEGDVFLGISTSGNSRNIIAALTLARAMGIKTIGLTGGTGGKLREKADCAIVVPSSETYKIQELHLPIYHALCRMLEETYFDA